MLKTLSVISLVPVMSSSMPLLPVFVTVRLVTVKLVMARLGMLTAPCGLIVRHEVDP